MDMEKLKQLGEKDMFDIKNKRLAEYMMKEFQENPQLAAPSYAGIPTFLAARHNPDLSECDIALIGLPFDLGVSDRSGTRLGPREIRNASGRVQGPMNYHTNIIPFDICRVVDAGDFVPVNQFNLDPAIEEIEAHYQEIKKMGVAPITAGGDHSITYPILKALGAHRPLGLIHIDAHCDTFSEYGGSKVHHGSPFRNAALAGAIDPERTVQIGIRGRYEFLWEFSYDSGMRVIHSEEFHEMGIGAVIEEARRIVGDAPTYISFDIDALDASIAPGTGSRELGGLTTHDVQSLIRGLQGLCLIGGDVVEVSPPYDPSGVTALIGAGIMFEILCVLADSIASRS